MLAARAFIYHARRAGWSAPAPSTRFSRLGWGRAQEGAQSRCDGLDLVDRGRVAAVEHGDLKMRAEQIAGAIRTNRLQHPVDVHRRTASVRPERHIELFWLQQRCQRPGNALDQRT